MPGWYDAITPRVRERFWSKVDMSAGDDECWLWTGSIGREGYGRFYFYNAAWLTHRVAYLLTNDNLTEILLVLHICNNRRCVNPKHLYLGDHRDNVRDAFAAGVFPLNTKITMEQAREIRSLYATGNYSQRKLASRYKVSQNRVWGILHNKTWHERD